MHFYSPFFHVVQEEDIRICSIRFTFHTACILVSQQKSEFTARGRRRERGTKKEIFAHISAMLPPSRRRSRIRSGLTDRTMSATA